jgi:curli biogenesis system outer membrane secretion channel CsgG
MRRQLLAVLFLAAVAGRAEDELPSVFVAPLDGDLSQVQGWQPALGEGLAEMLITELNKLHKFTVLESTALGALKDEIRLGEEGYVGKEEKVDKGGFAGADFMFRGKVTRFGSKAQTIGLGGFIPGSGGNLGIKTTTSDVRIDWRFTDTATRKIVKSDQAVGSEKGTGFDLGVGVGGHGGNIGFGNSEFMNSALGKATVKALNAIVEEVSGLELPKSGRKKAKAAAAEKAAEAAEAASAARRATPGKVLAVPAKGVLIVSLGGKQGFKAGDKLRLFQAVDTKDAQGNVVFSEEKPAGEITLDSVQEERSKAVCAPEVEAKEGWVVRAP